jgi:DNA-binding CsgD family transcriptional regulator
MDETLRNVRDVYRLLDACLCHGGDPSGWRLTLSEGLRDLFGGINAHCGEYRHILCPDRATVLDFVATDWPAPEQGRLFARDQVSGKHRDDPLLKAIRARGRQCIVTSVADLMPPEAYFLGAFYRENLAEAGIGDFLIAKAPVQGTDSDGRSIMHVCVRGRDMPFFAAADRRLMQILTVELVRLVGTRLADTTSPVHGLTARQRETLAHLLRGAGLIEAAAAMGLSVGTFKKYAAGLYALFGTRGRAELQARFAGTEGLRLPGAEISPIRNRIRRIRPPMAQPWASPDHLLRPG